MYSVGAKFESAKFDHNENCIYMYYLNGKPEMGEGTTEIKYKNKILRTPFKITACWSPAR